MLGSLPDDPDDLSEPALEGGVEGLESRRVLPALKGGVEELESRRVPGMLPETRVAGSCGGDGRIELGGTGAERCCGLIDRSDTSLVGRLCRILGPGISLDEEEDDEPISEDGVHVPSDDAMSSLQLPTESFDPRARKLNAGCNL